MTKREKAIEKIVKMAIDLTKRYSFDKYSKLLDACEENDVFFAEDRSGEHMEFWIEDDHFVCED